MAEFAPSGPMHILFLGHRLKVLRVHTAGLSTEMVEDETFANPANEEAVRDTMGETIALPIQPSVTAAVHACQPLPTLRQAFMFHAPDGAQDVISQYLFNPRTLNEQEFRCWTGR